MHILLDELERVVWAVYPDGMEARFRFQTNVTVEHINTIKDYQYWHQYVTVDQHEDVEQLEIYGCLSLNDFYFGMFKPLFTWVHVHCNVELGQV